MSSHPLHFFPNHYPFPAFFKLSFNFLYLVETKIESPELPGKISYYNQILLTDSVYPSCVLIFYSAKRFLSQPSSFVKLFSNFTSNFLPIFLKVSSNFLQNFVILLYFFPTFPLNLFSNLLNYLNYFTNTILPYFLQNHFKFYSNYQFFSKLLHNFSSNFSLLSSNFFKIFCLNSNI